MDERAIGDMYLAAAFLSYDIPLLRIERDQPRRQKFIFAGVPPRVFVQEEGVVMMVEHPTLEEIETKFIAKTLMFPPSYPDAIRRIKSSIHSGDNN
jgi:hypothetical protein